jgi:hypothetical protein
MGFAYDTRQNRWDSSKTRISQITCAGTIILLLIRGPRCWEVTTDVE